jgi:hypothetical protein
MKVYGDLVLSGSREALAKAVEAIESSMASGWQRSQDLESRVGIKDTRCFVAPSTASHRSGALWLAYRPEQANWYVSNITPMETGSLSEDEYNSILREFYENFVRPTTRATGIEAELGKFEKGARDYMTEAAEKQLDRFSVSANKSTGSGHPADQERWFAFIVQIVRDGYGPDASTLADLLQESFGWSEEKAHELALEYEFGRDLLRYASHV